MKIYSTGEVIDKLNVGDIAECVESKIEGWVGTKIIAKEYTWDWLDKDNNKEEFYLSKEVQKCKWKILPRYVSFNNAMDAFEKGKYVYFHGTPNKVLEEGIPLPSKFLNISNSRLAEWNPYSLYIGKWTIGD